MPKVIVLGSSNAIPTQGHENTHLVIVGQERVVLVDCVSNPIFRLAQANIHANDLTDLIITHFHPDHVSGVPLLLMDMWLMGRKLPLHIYALHHTLERLEQLMACYGWEDWPDFFPVAFHRLPASEMTPVLDGTEFAIYASPVRHLIPTIGLRVEFHASKKVLAYSGDTEPCTQVIHLASGADVLIHEASGEVRGHSSASQAGEVAARAEVGALYLIHYPSGPYAIADLIDQARRHYAGQVALAIDFMTLEF
jgi:ribonuclease Z